MARKISPKLFRLGTIYNWNARWFDNKNFGDTLHEDVVIRDFLKNKLKEALIDKIIIERTGSNLNVVIHAAKPGLIIGRGGAGAEDLKKAIKTKFLKGKDTKINLNLNIIEVTKPFLSAAILAKMAVIDLEKRTAFRRILKQTLEKATKSGAKGVKACVAGRLNGAEIARTEVLMEGSVPLHNLRADIDFATDTAKTMYGAIGVKVWVYKGEVFGKNLQ